MAQTSLMYEVTLMSRTQTALLLLNHSGAFYILIQHPLPLTSMFIFVHVCVCVHAFSYISCLQEEEQRLSELAQQKKQGFSLGSIAGRWFNSKQQWRNTENTLLASFTPAELSLNGVGNTGRYVQIPSCHLHWIVTFLGCWQQTALRPPPPLPHGHHMGGSCPVSDHCRPIFPWRLHNMSSETDHTPGSTHLKATLRL